MLVFAYPTPSTPAPVLLPILWNVGSLMVLVGGYWFFFFIRVDVAKEGHSLCSANIHAAFGSKPYS